MMDSDCEIVETMFEDSRHVPIGFTENKIMHYFTDSDVNILSFPNELYAAIFQYVSILDRIKCVRVCRHWFATLPHIHPPKFDTERLSGFGRECAVLFRNLMPRMGSCIRELFFRVSLDDNLLWSLESSKLIADNCTNLEILHILYEINSSSDVVEEVSDTDYMNIRDDSFEPLQNLAKLKTLCVYEGLFDGDTDVFVFLSLLFEKLQCVRIEGGLQSFGNRIRFSGKALNSVIFKDTVVSAICLSEICELCNLRELRLYESCCNIDVDLSLISKLKQLQHLTVCSTAFSDSDLAIICQHCAFIHSLDIHSSTLLTEFAYIAKLTNLLQLDLSFCRLKDADLLIICSHCLLINKLAISHCELLSDCAPLVNLVCIVELRANRVCSLGKVLRRAHWSNLIILEANGCGITDDALKALAKESLKLKRLNLTNNQITDEGVCALLMKCRNLSDLRLVRTNITTFFLRFLNHHPSILCIDIRDCGAIDDSLTEGQIYRNASGISVAIV